MPRDLGELSVGERWAYRQKQTEPVICVEVMRLGTGRPPRVQVRFVDDEFEGREEWVPPARLKVLWADVDAWRANERRWTDLLNASNCSQDSAEANALMMVSDYMSDWDLAESHYNDSGIMRIPDVDALVADLDLDREFVTGDTVSFVDDAGELLVPWRATRAIVKRLVEKNANFVIQKVEADEQEARQHNQWGYTDRGRFIDAEICADVDKEYAPARALIRQWCGTEARERYDELAALRVEVVRLGKLVERAIRAVRGAGNAREADSLERELGIPLEVLRRAAERDQGP